MYGSQTIASAIIRKSLITPPLYKQTSQKKGRGKNARYSTKPGVILVVDRPLTAFLCPLRGGLDHLHGVIVVRAICGEFEDFRFRGLSALLVPGLAQADYLSVVIRAPIGIGKVLYS